MAKSFKSRSTIKYDTDEGELYSGVEDDNSGERNKAKKRSVPVLIWYSIFSDTVVPITIKKQVDENGLVASEEEDTFLDNYGTRYVC